MPTYNLGNVRGPAGKDAKVNGMTEANIVAGLGVSVTNNTTAKTITIAANNPNTTGAKVSYARPSGSTLSASATTVQTAIDELAAKMPKNASVFSFFLDTTKSVPTEMISYPSDSLNANYTPAGLNSSNVFDYGSWEEAFFIKNTKPCMLKYDGTVDYYLNKKNYNQKEDGTAHSNLNNPAYEGNVMVEFPQVWICISTSSLDGASKSKPRFFIADRDLTDSDHIYHAFAHTDANGHIVNKIYMPAYEGSNPNNAGVLRSLSGQTVMVSQTGTTERLYAQKNNPSKSSITAVTQDPVAWDMSPLCDHELLMILCMLISKSTNNQAKFGNGVTGESAAHATGAGDVNTGGFFYGTTANSAQSVKIFGIENPYGNVWMRKTGCVHDAQGRLRVKMTPPYVTNPATETNILDTYLDLGIGSANDTYIKECKIDNEFGLAPFNGGGSATTYYCDYGWGHTSNYKNTFAFFGARWSYGTSAGLFVWSLYDAVSNTYPDLGSSVSCKPLAA